MKVIGKVMFLHLSVILLMGVYVVGGRRGWGYSQGGQA